VLGNDLEHKVQACEDEDQDEEMNTEDQSKVVHPATLLYSQGSRK
jgi:hypothetical protein